MARAPQNPDRNFSADGDPLSFEGMKRWLAQSKPALPYNEAARLRIGKVITEVILPSNLRRPVRYLSTGKRAWLP
jgi:hypothetical protein